MSIGAAIDVDAADGILDEIEFDAVDDDALEAAVERRVTAGELGDASEVIAAADEKRFVQSQLRESARGNAHYFRLTVDAQTACKGIVFEVKMSRFRKIPSSLWLQ